LSESAFFGFVWERHSPQLLRPSSSGSAFAPLALCCFDHFLGSVLATCARLPSLWGFFFAVAGPASDRAVSSASASSAPARAIRFMLAPPWRGDVPSVGSATHGVIGRRRRYWTVLDE
jgi:hypothetical protein